MQNPSLLSIRNMRIWYTPDTPVLNGFALNLASNEAVGLIGLNGAGKTTLMRTIAGLLKNFRQESLLFKGSPFSFRDKDFLKNRYIVFAEDRSFPYFTFREYLAYAAASYSMPLPDVSGLVEGFQFEKYTDTLLKELSTGNLKKVFLITAFALHPALLLLDEPVNGLDFQSTEYLYQLISGYRQYGTVLFSSHILESICLTSDRILVLEQGQITKSFITKETKPDSIREALRP